MNYAAKGAMALQETTELVARSAGSLFKRPFYAREIVQQADAIGFGSLAIIVLTGFFTGAVLCVQTYPSLKEFGVQEQTGHLVALSLMRELAPVLSALMFAGRAGSAIAAELGSMSVSEQIDAMRALGCDPIRKLVAPRIVGLVLTLPLLTLVADAVGIFGGGVVATNLFGMTLNNFLASVRSGLELNDIVSGLFKPVVFALIIGAVSCWQGLRTTGGTVGVGISTTNAVVQSSILVIVADFFLAKTLQIILGTA